MTYLSEVIADSPVHYWRCADPGGQLAHDIGSSPLHLHGLGTPTLGFSGPNVDGGSMDCCLDNIFANCGDAVVRPTGNLSLELWIWQQRNRTGTNLYLSWPQSPDLALYSTASQYVFAYNSAGPNSGATQPQLQAWTHLVGTWDGANARLYVNSNLFGPVASTPLAPGSAIIELSANVGLTFFGHSFVSEVAIYTSTLSSARVAAHFAAADNTAQAPIYSQAGGISGQIANVQYTGGTQQILADLFSHYANSP